ncbi:MULTISPECIES: hypothetical protein [Microcystis]|nr:MULTISPECIES: hypothetical protein [Microcystis]MCZ8249267.1 hypothetical protein [Microcystis sp. LE19-195.1E]
MLVEMRQQATGNSKGIWVDLANLKDRRLKCVLAYLHGGVGSLWFWATSEQ